MPITIDLAELDPDVTVEPITATITVGMTALNIPVPGPTGAAGVGVPVGGTTGQVLAKASATNYDTAWTAVAAGGGAPTGPAGGVLGGTYPNPGFVADMATQAELDAVKPFFIDGFGFWDGSTVPTGTLSIDVIHPMYPTVVTIEAQTMTAGDRVMLVAEAVGFFTVTASGAWTALTPPADGQFIVFDNVTFPDEAGDSSWAAAYRGTIFQLVDGALVRTSTPGLASLVAQFINSAGTNIDYLNGGNTDWNFTDGGTTEAPANAPGGMFVAEGWGWTTGGPESDPAGTLGPTDQGITYRLEDPYTVQGQFLNLKRTADPATYTGPVIIDAWVTGTPTASGDYMIGGSTIDGAHTLELTQLNESVTLYASSNINDGGIAREWLVISHVVEGATVADDSVTNAKLAEMAAATVKANLTGGTANPTDATVAQMKTLLAYVKGDVALGNVDNTADAAKPVSTAQQTALDLKAPTVSPTFTGTAPVIPDAAAATHAVNRQTGDARYVAPTLVDAKGDLIVATAADTVARRAVGTDGQILTADSVESTGVKWATATSAPNLRPKRTQLEYSDHFALTTRAPAVNRVHTAPFQMTGTTTFDRMAIVVTSVGSAGSVVRLGIYADDGTGRPGTLTLDAGTVTTETLGVRTISISQQLTPGLWWIAAVAQTAAPTLRCWDSAVAVPGYIGLTMSTTELHSMGWFQSSISGALPSPWGASYSQQAGATLTPLTVWLRAA